MASSAKGNIKAIINTILSFPGSLPVVLLLSTLATLAVSWLITVAGPVR